jgi:hypothetical protein
MLEFVSHPGPSPSHLWNASCDFTMNTAFTSFCRGCLYEGMAVADVQKVPRKAESAERPLQCFDGTCPFEMGQRTTLAVSTTTSSTARTAGPQRRCIRSFDSLYPDLPGAL